MAVASYHNEWACFPPSYVADANGTPMHSWRVLILKYAPKPYSNIYEEYRFDEPWNGPHNRKLAPKIGEFYRRQGLGADNAYTTSFVAVTGPHTSWPGPVSSKRSEFRDDPDTTILAVEMADTGIGWMEPRDLPFDRMSYTLNDRAKKGPGSQINGARVLFASGHVHELNDGFDPRLLRAMLTNDGGEIIRTEEERWTLEPSRK